MNLKDLIVAIYVWIINLLFNRQNQNLIANQVQQPQQQQPQQQQQQQPQQQPQQQQQQRQQQNTNANDTNRNSPLQITVQQQQQQQQPQQQQPQKNVFQDIDKKKPISYALFKQRAFDYLNLKEIRNDQVLEYVIVRLSEENEDDLYERMTSILKPLENDRAKYLLVNVVVDHFKTHASLKNSEKWLEFLRVLFSCSITDTAERQEMRELLTHLPAAALGDTNDRNKSRVLVDLLSDLNDAMSKDRRRVQEIKAFVEETSSILVQYVQTHRFHNSPESMQFVKSIELLSLILHNLTKVHRSKLLLQNLLISRVLPTVPHQRTILLDNLFSYTPTIVPSLSTTQTQDMIEEITQTTITTTTTTNTTN